MKPGSLVLCIASFYDSIKIMDAPMAGNIYTVREFDTRLDDFSGDFIFLEEIRSFEDCGFMGTHEVSWHHKRFIEVQPPMKINIEEFYQRVPEVTR